MNEKSMPKMEGFTLVEIIVAITVSAVLAAFFVTYMGSALLYSGKPITTLSETYEISQAIAEVTADYRDDLDNGTLDLSDFKDNLSGNCDTYNVTCSAMFLNFRDENDVLLNNNGTIEPEEETSATTKFLLVTVTKSGRSMRVLLTKD